VALVRERTILTERPPLVGIVSADFLGIDVCRVLSAADPYGLNLGFLDRSRYFFDFSENLVAPVIEPRPLDL
jgi:hypothetical protein